MRYNSQKAFVEEHEPTYAKTCEEKEPWVVNQEDCSGCVYYDDHGTYSMCDYFPVTGKIKQPMGTPAKGCKYRKTGKKIPANDPFTQYEEARKKKNKAAREKHEQAESQDMRRTGRSKPEGFATRDTPTARDEKHERAESPDMRRTGRRPGRPPLTEAEKPAKAQAKEQAEEEKSERQKEEERQKKKERQKISSRKLYTRRVAARQCTKCGAQLPDGWKKKTCPPCTEHENARWRARAKKEQTRRVCDAERANSKG